MNTPIRQHEQSFTQSKAILTLDNVSLTLSEQNIFTGISLKINTGEKVALLGESGIGKSSLLKLISGIHPPTKGGLNNTAHRIGYVFQEPRLLPWLTVEQNITEVMKANNMLKKQREIKLIQLLKEVELSQYKHYYPHQLSGGMAQRVSLARAFAITPDLLLLDEPFSALDNKLIKQLSQLLSHFLTTKTTMIYVSHQLEQVLPLTNSCLVLHKDDHDKQITIHHTDTINKRDDFLQKYKQQTVVNTTNKEC